MPAKPVEITCAESGRHFVTSGGAPFFWLADTAWNAALRADTADWMRYLKTRQEQGFTVIQFVATPWRGCKKPLHGSLFQEDASGLKFDERAWRKMEEWIGLIVEHGMTPAPVMIWDSNPDEPFFKFRTETCIATGKRMLERWHKFSPVWILNGDGDYRSAQQDAKLRTIGRAIFADHPEETVTMHPGGITWIGDQYANEPWFKYSPLGGRISLNRAPLAVPARSARWINPSNGECQPCVLDTNPTRPFYEMDAPDPNDWLLVLENA